MRSVSSSAADTIHWPSGLKAQAATARWCPNSVAFSALVSRSHTLSVPSFDEDARVSPSGDTAQQVTSRACPEKVRAHCARRLALFSQRSQDERCGAEVEAAACST